MQFVPVRDFRVNSASVWSALESEEKLVITTHGQPTAVMLKVDGESLMDTLAAVDQAQWTSLITSMQTKASAAAGQMSLDEINAEIAAARAE
ncbi:MAG: type II toxin-antitoxin system Phd/YefM family antitoxin [Propionibacteriaceae bacterium]|jgi:PHD/YefM family antitoxin component YafN of YafNO toxin-antitoxin module|nr:type II toxin-antitoxin system Phd/YefM family antitoxin [Propionibacteriaceae bacterium]